MAITDYKLTETDFSSTGAEALPDKVIGQAEYVKGMIDGPSKDVIMPKYNNLIDAIVAEYMLKNAPAFASDVTIGLYKLLFSDAMFGNNGGGVLAAYCKTGFYVLNESGASFGPITAARFNVGTTGRVGPNGANVGIFSNSTIIEALNSGGSAYAEMKASKFTQASSERFKNIIEEMPEHQAKKLLDLKFIKFTYKTEYNDDGEKIHYGIRAEQANDLGLGDIVSYDAEGRPDGVDYSLLSAYLGVLVQKQEKRISELEKKVEKFDALSALLVSKGILAQEEIDGLEG